MIPITSTISKTDFPYLKKQVILYSFFQELKDQRIEDVIVSDDEINFKNEKFNLSFCGGRDKFIGFDSGKIKVTENDSAFTIEFRSSSNKTYRFFALLSLAILVLALVISGPSLNSFLLGFFALLIFLIEYSLHSYFNMSTYFTNLNFGK